MDHGNFWNNHAVLPPNGNWGNWTGPIAHPESRTIETGEQCKISQATLRFQRGISEIIMQCCHPLANMAIGQVPYVRRVGYRYWYFNLHLMCTVFVIDYSICKHYFTSCYALSYMIVRWSVTFWKWKQVSRIDSTHLT